MLISDKSNKGQWQHKTTWTGTYKSLHLNLLPLQHSNTNPTLYSFLFTMFSAQQELAMRREFSFPDPLRRISYSFDEIEYDAWAERIKGSYGFFSRSNGHEMGPWAQEFQQSSNHYSNSAKGESWLSVEEGNSFQFGSPPMWKKPVSPSSLSDDHDNRDKHLHCNLQEQAITGYQQMLVSACELSMRDLIELPKIVNSKQEANRKGGATREEEMKVKKVKKGFSRSMSVDTRVFLLKMFIPKSLSRRRKSFGTFGSSPKGPMKPPRKDGEKGRLEKSIDGTQWRSNELATLSRSNSSSRRMSSCYPFCTINKRKAR